MKAIEQEGDGERRAADADAPSRWRLPDAEFLPSFVSLQDAVREACLAQVEWEAKVTAGIRAALRFAAENPAAAHALTIDARRQALAEGDREQEVIRYFAGLIAEAAPSEKRFPISTDEGTVESIAMVVRGHLLARTTDQLPELTLELVYLALMPYAGLSGARRWTDSIGSLEG